MKPEKYPNSGGFITIRNVVASVMDDLRLYDMKEFEHIKKIVVEGVKKLNIYYLYNVNVVYLKINDDLTVDLPSDYVDYVKIGVLDGGKIWALTRDDDMALPRKDECGLNEKINYKGNIASDYGEYYDLFVDHFRNGEYIAGAYYNRGGINFGYYRIDIERRQIKLSGSVSKDNEIVLEYKSSGVKINDTTYIPLKALWALKAYTHWQIVEYDPRVPMNEKERKKQQFFETANELTAIEGSITYDEYTDFVYGISRQTTKR